MSTGEGFGSPVTPISELGVIKIIPDFRKQFPEFGDVDKYPTDLINFWVGIADNRLNKKRWGDLLLHGISLFVAHHITLARMAQDSVSQGGSVSTNPGIMSSKSVGGVSVSYDTNAAKLEDAGNYNLTVYGREFIQLARIIGIGGLQLLK